MIQKLLTDPGDGMVDSVWDYGGRYNSFIDYDWRLNKPENFPEFQ
ncbi:hypothetical protein [Marinimicrobium alkaliphilum]|nr:hypothetical protein [Marinimicrobium alkaliphilum]